MRLRIYLALIVAAFLYAVYFFVSHAFVIVRLTAVLGFAASVFLLLFVVVLLFKGRL